MCLATVYGKKKEGESILIKNASRMDVDGTTIRIRDIMGAEIEVLINSMIILSLGIL